MAQSTPAPVSARGLIGSAPALRTLPSGRMRCSFRLDADGPSPDGPAAPFDVVAWDEQGEEVALSLGRGRLVAVEGMLQDGSEEGIPEICATSVQALDGEDEERGEGTPVPVVPEISTNAHMLPQRSAPAEHTSPF